MKNTILLIILTVMINACKKNYTCSCTESTIQSGSAGITETKGEYATSYTKVTKKYANEHCTSGKDIATSTNGTSTITVDHVWNCTLDGGSPR